LPRSGATAAGYFRDFLTHLQHLSPSRYGSIAAFRITVTDDWQIQNPGERRRSRWSRGWRKLRSGFKGAVIAPEDAPVLPALASINLLIDCPLQKFNLMYDYHLWKANFALSFARRSLMLKQHRFRC
jgi:hypothetical protein